MVTADLTPFGFTVTESRVYAALLQLGPATGYAVARAARLARANAYGALDGLVTRGAASRAPGRPARYRPTDPQALLARLAAQQGEALERLSRALQDASRPGEPETRAVEGSRALANLIMQVVARAERRVAGVVAADLLRLTLPAWRRAAERATLEVRVAGEPPPEAAPLSFGTVPETQPTLLLIDDRQTVAVAGAAAERSGIWSSHPAVAAMARAALGAGALP
jgi:sugar-specific transcriptional regulator TrmB